MLTSDRTHCIHALQNTLRGLTILFVITYNDGWYARSLISLNTDLGHLILCFWSAIQLTFNCLTSAFQLHTIQEPGVIHAYETYYFSKGNCRYCSTFSWRSNSLASTQSSPVVWFANIKFRPLGPKQGQVIIHCLWSGKKYVVSVFVSIETNRVIVVLWWHAVLFHYYYLFLFKNNTSEYCFPDAPIKSNMHPWFIPSVWFIERRV